MKLLLDTNVFLEIPLEQDRSEEARRLPMPSPDRTLHPEGRGMSEANGSRPVYQLRARRHSSADLQLEVWQLPSSATPNIKRPKRLAGLRGRNLALFEHHLGRRLKREGIALADIGVGHGTTFELAEERALQLGLMFRTLAPMRNRDNMRDCVTGAEAMAREEAAYWLGMAMHRKYPRRVLMSLRCLLVDPKRES